MGTKNNPGEFDCYANAEPDEPMFVLLARDRTAPQAVEAWVAAREPDHMTEMDLDNPIGQHRATRVTDPAKLDEARACAAAMREWRRVHVPEWQPGQGDLIEDDDGAPLPPSLQRDGELWAMLYAVSRRPGESAFDEAEVVDALAIVLAPFIKPVDGHGADQ
jgi:hypothetical protein